MARHATPVTRIATAAFGIAKKQETLPSFSEVAGMAFQQYQAEFGVVSDPVRKHTIICSIRQVLNRMSQEYGVSFAKNEKMTGRPVKTVGFVDGFRKELSMML